MCIQAWEDGEILTFIPGGCRYLESGGGPREVLDMIPEVCDTRSICRRLARPGPEHHESIDLPDKFNEQVESDLMFAHQQKLTVLHLVDRCTRYQEAMILDFKTEKELFDAIYTLWVARHGPPK